MRKIILLFWAAIVAIAMWMLWPRSAAPRPVPAHFTTATRPRSGSDSDHIAWLQKLGFVPVDGPIRDRWLGQYTSWWGKRLDPKEFWKGRVLWCDASAMAAAGACGRAYPPVPQDNPAVPYDDDRRPQYESPEGYDIPTVSSRREREFWERFNRTHPMPPEQIESQQASDTLRFDKNNALFFGCPPEALSDEAVHWARILRWRTEYQADLALPPGQMAMMTNHLFSKVSVDRKLITEPLSDAQLKAANAWKLAYLQRLRREKTDDSYIDAYLKAWNLSPAEVFSENTKD